MASSSSESSGAAKGKKGTAALKKLFKRFGGGSIRRVQNIVRKVTGRK